MNEKIRRQVLSLLAEAPDCPEKTEIADELTQNLTDKYEDLVAQGRDPDDAYREVLAGIGDISEMISFLREVGASRQTESKNDASGAPFADFEERVRNFSSQLARSIEEPMRSMADDIESAAKQLQQNIRRSGRTYCYDTTYEADGIEELLIEMKSGDLTLRPGPDQYIRITERSRAALSDEQRISVERNGDCLRIAQGRSYVGFVWFGFGVISSDLEIELPARLWRAVTATGVNEVSMTELKCRTLGIKSTSGDIKITRLESETLTIDSTSGDITVSGNIDNVDIRTKSGDVDLKDMVVSNLSVDQISGDMDFSGAVLSALIKSKSGDTFLRTHSAPRALTIDSISGDVRVILPENDGFAIQYKRVSGDFKSDFGLMTSLNSRKGVASYKNASEPSYTISTVSGDISVLRGS